MQKISANTEFIPFTSLLSLQSAIVSLYVCGVSRVCTTHVTYIYTFSVCMPFGCWIKTKARMEMVVCHFFFVCVYELFELFMSTFSIWGALRALQNNKNSALFVAIVCDSHASATI